MPPFPFGVLMRCFQCGAEHAFHALTASHKYAFCSQECKDTALRQFLSPHYYYENPKDHPHYKSASTVELQDYDSRETIPWHVKNIRRHQADFLKSYAEDRPRAIADAEKKLNEHILAQAERERTCDARSMVTVRPSVCYLLACDWKARPRLREVARVRARTVLPPGLGAGTAYRGAGSDSIDGGANPACAAGGARRAGSGDCASACEVARAAMLPARMKDAIRIRIMVYSFGPLRSPKSPRPKAIVRSCGVR